LVGRSKCEDGICRKCKTAIKKKSGRQFSGLCTNCAIQAGRPDRKKLRRKLKFKKRRK